jgi:hypothetical protein
MKKSGHGPILFSIFLAVALSCCSTGREQLLSKADLAFLADMTRQVVDSSRILPWQELPPAIKSFGPNNSGITLIRPGGRDCYPSFWIRDYGMSLESGFITEKEQRDILLYTAARQSDSSWITKTGSPVPLGAIPDHIRVSDGLPVYFPGTYDYVYQGSDFWKVPPYCDQFYFIHMAWYYLQESGERGILNETVNGIAFSERLAMAFREVPATDRELVVIYDSLPTCDFGFRDVIGMTGEVCFGSLFRLRAALELSDISMRLGDKLQAGRYGAIARKIKENLVPVFADPRGMLRASTGKSRQPDVWATAFAVYSGALRPDAADKASVTLAKAYREGTLAMDGQIRHVLTTDDFSATTAWEKSLAAKNSYQNGAYWGTPTGWVCRAIARTDPDAARQLAKEFVDHLRKTDFRIPGSSNGSPWECEFTPSGWRQNPVYMTTVTAPFAALRSPVNIRIPHLPDPRQLARGHQLLIGIRPGGEVLLVGVE